MPNDADNGVNVYAVAKGVITYVDNSTGSVRIRHTVDCILKNDYTYKADCWYSWYGHMEISADIKKGAEVTVGQVIGTISNKATSENHLHFALYASTSSGGTPTIPISPFWLSGDYANSSLYADDANGTRKGTVNGVNVYDAYIFRELPR